MEWIELNCLCKHMEKLRRSQASISINSCIELSITQFYPVSIVKEATKLQQKIIFVSTTKIGENVTNSLNCQT